MKKALPLYLALAACGSGGSSGAKDGSADAREPTDGGQDAPRKSDGGKTDGSSNSANCVPPGTPNNKAGVGGYCTPDGGECADGGTICTADFGSIVPPHAWFCTNLCTLDGGESVCGDPGPACVATPEGEAVCLPETCLQFLGGAEGGVGDTAETLEVGGVERTFILHLPTGYTGKSPVPLVFDFHPLSVSAAVWKGVSSWGATADKEGFIVVWPQGIDDEWNVGRCCGHADDVAFTRAMITKVSAEKSIDPKRIYATGCSNGGGMSYALACDAADVIAAIAPVNFDCITGAENNPSCGSCSPSRPISETQFMGTADMYVPYDGGPTSVVAGLDFPSAKANFATWAGLDGCKETPRPESGQPSCDSYDTCKGGAAVTLCTIDKGTHCGSYGTYPISQIAWKAFQSESLP